jgi:hypothetical protein
VDFVIVPFWEVLQDFPLTLRKSFETARVMSRRNVDFDEKEEAIWNTSSKNQKKWRKE